MLMASDSQLISSFSKLSTDEHSPTQLLGAFQNEQALLTLMDRTGYNMIQENGQRKYGPPPGWEGPVPPRGCEVFVGKIPRDCYEDELVPIFERVGKIYELRLMMDFSGSNRGYAFVMYTSKADAQRAVREMNNYEIRKGRLLGVCQSVDNCRLFVGGIPKNKTKEEIMSEMIKVTEEVVDVIVYPSATDKSKNRGFAFVEYESHRAAAMARRKLIPGRIQLWGHQIAVDWAEPESEVDEDIMKTVKILYVRNLMLTTTEEHLEQVFNTAGGGTPENKIVERVKKLKDYAFVHFAEREQALQAMKAINGTDIEGSRVEVVLAKPVDKNDPARQKKSNTALMPNMIPALPYDPQTLSAYYAQIGAIPQSEDAFYRGFPTLTGTYANRGISRTPMRGRGRGAAGSRAAGAGASARVYGTRRKSSSPADVVIPAIANANPNGGGTFMPNKMCRTVDEAQNYAAEYVMMSLGVPYPDGSAGLAGIPGGMDMSLGQAMPMPMGAYGYLGQPITAHSYVNPAGMPDFAALTAAYAMQGLPVTTAAAGLISPTQLGPAQSVQQLMLNGEKPTVQNQTSDLAAYAALAAGPAPAPAEAFPQY